MTDASTHPPQLTPIEGIKREIQRSVRSYISGHAEPSVSKPRSDDGWFGPDSVTWLVQSDWSTLIGGIHAVLVQTLHPPTMAGVADHSNYKSDPFGRLHRTADFIGVTTYGSTKDAERMVKTIRKVHDRVVGTTPDGTPYSANDPHNLAWVHCTEVDAFLRSFQRYGQVRIPAAEADQYVDEMARVGEAMGVIDPPRSVAELDDRLLSYLPELRYSAQARDAVRFLLTAPQPPAAQAPYLVMFGAAVNLLPGWARRKLWLPPTIPYVSDAMVVPAAKAVIGTLDWAMEPPLEIQKLREQRAA